MFLQETKTDIADIAHTGLQFQGLVYNLEASERPQIPIAKSRRAEACKEAKMGHFQILDICFSFFWGGGGGGGGSKLSILIATMKRIEWNSDAPPPAQNEQLNQGSFKNNNNELKLKQSTSCTIDMGRNSMQPKIKIKIITFL